MTNETLGPSSKEAKPIPEEGKKEKEKRVETEAKKEGAEDKKTEQNDLTNNG